MEQSTISLRVRATGDGLRLNFWFDDVLVGTRCLNTESQEFSHIFQDDIASHVFGIEMLGKTTDHTVLDAQGTILQDLVAEIADVCLDGIPLAHTLTLHSRYFHDHNGTTQPVEQDFFGVMGCNGRVNLRFSSPVYLWLLENM